MTYISKFIRGMHRWTKICTSRAFNEKLNKLLKETRRIRPFNYDSVFIKNNEFKKYNTLLELKLKALSMEENMQICGGMQYMIYIFFLIGKVCKRYEKNERLHMHMISQMEKVMQTFEYEPLVFSPKPRTSYEEEDRGNTNGARPSSTKTIEKELGDFKGGKDNPKKAVANETNKIYCARG
jgi:hypothetical protein